MTDIFDDHTTELNESFGTSSVMNVNELRMLYYGRMNLYGTPTSSGEIKVNDKDDYDRPNGYVAFTINDIVGRKVKTSEFYMAVYRIDKTRSSRKFVENIRMYDTSDLSDDILVLREIRYLDQDIVDEIINTLSVSSTLRSPFDRFWEITKRCAQSVGSSNYKAIWRKLLIDLGYNGFADPSGSAKLIKKREPVAIVLDANIELLDIVPIQKHRKDPRRRVAAQVNRKVKKLATVRNRIAKQRFVNREEPIKVSTLAAVAGVVGGLLQ